MLVPVNSLMQGFSGIHWSILDAMAKLVSANIMPKLLLLGSLTASGDLIPPAYTTGLLIARPDSTLVANYCCRSV